MVGTEEKSLQDFVGRNLKKNVYLRITLIWIQTEGVDCINVDQDKRPVAAGCGNDIYIYIYIYMYTR